MGANKRTNMTKPIPKEVLDLARFMCATWSEIDNWAYEHCHCDDALMHYPVIQGTSNQVKLNRIGKQSYNVENISIAVDWILKNE